MAYGTVKVDNVTFTYNAVDATTTFSGFYASTTNNLTLSGTASAATFTGTTANFTNVNAQNISVTTALSGLSITGGTAGFTTVTGTTVTGTTANFVSGVFTTQVSGTTITGTTASFTSGVFTNISGTTATFTSGIIASGTAALPSLAILSDPNTGIFSPGADQLAVATNGTGRLFIDASGNVGINTVSAIAPGGYGYAREFAFTGATSGDSSVGFNLRGSRTVAGGFVDINFWHQSTANRAYIQARRGSSDSAIDLDFIASGGAGMRITSGGLVGIGTSSPGNLLHVESSFSGTLAKIKNNAGSTSADTALEIESSTTAAKTFLIKNSGTERFYVKGDGTSYFNGSVGIGTTSPDAKLDFGVTANNTYLINLRKNGNSRIALGINSDYGTLIGCPSDISAGGALASFGTISVSDGTTFSETARFTRDGKFLVGTTSSPGAGELLAIKKASTGTEGAGIRFEGTYSVADGDTQTITVSNGALVFVSENTTGDGALFFCGYKSSTVTLISDPNNRYANSEISTKICVFKSANTNSVSVKNRTGGTANLTIGKINNSD